MADPDAGALTSSDFAGRIGQTFRARAPDGTEIDLTLTRCDETRYGDPDGWRNELGRVPFSIEFTTGTEHAAGQGTFKITGDGELSGLEVFMTPLGADGDALRYEAVFS